MSVKANERPCKKAAATVNAGVDFRGQLSSGELLTGTPTVTVSPSGPTISNVQRNSTAQTINDESVPVDQAVLFTIAGGTAGVEYTFTATCSTDSTPSQTLVGDTVLYVV